MWWRNTLVKALTLIIWLCPALDSQGQTPNQSTPSRIIEETITNSEGELENETIIDDFSYLANNPIAINDTLANWSPVITYGLLNQIQVENIKSYLLEFGPMLSKNELLAVPGLSYQEAKQLLPYVTVGELEKEVVPLLTQLAKGRNSLLLRYQSILEQQAGYNRPDTINNRYLGDKAKIYLRYRHQYGNKLSYGIVADKDPGETLFNGNNGFDFYSFHFYTANPEKTLSKLAVGDYEIKIGQGLMHWNGFALGKGVSSANIHRSAPVMRAFNSANEYNFLRGLSAEINAGKVALTPWFSQRKLDANFQTDTTDNIIQLLTIKEDGLHRTPNEIEDENVFTLTNTGVNATYQGKNVNIGLAASYAQFSEQVQPGTQTYRFFDFEGDEALGLSLHYTAVLKNAYLFGETAMDKNQNLATIHGVQGFLDDGVKATFALRSYAKNYRALYADGFAESSASQNEEGIYLGFELNPAKRWFVNTYADIFRFPYVRFRVDKPSTGYEFFLRSRYQASNTTEIELRSRYEEKALNLPDESAPINFVGQQQRATNRLEVRYRPNENLLLKSRLEHSYYNLTESENGFIAFQDMAYKFPNQPIKLNTRFALFNTPSFNSRIYAYENDLLYNFNVPAYSGQGTRWYGMAKWDVNRRLDVWLRFSQSNFSDRETVSSGLNEIEGNRRTDVRTQLLWKF